ncbi:hypothetical protein Q3G72_034248 [Acer saccharum]|nr:hypothetical protein Q3G72_034248 [Acer saccharum]
MEPHQKAPSEVKVLRGVRGAPPFEIHILLKESAVQALTFFHLSDYFYTSSISSFFNHNKRLNFTTFFIEPPSVSSSSSCSTSHTSASTHIRGRKSVKIERSEGGCFSVSQNNDDDDESIDLGQV